MTEPRATPDAAPKTVPALSPDERNVAEGEPSSDDQAIHETEQLSSGWSLDDLKSAAVRGEHDRTETFRNHFEIIAIVGMYLVAGLVFSSVLVWFWHILMPQKWHYLNSDQISAIQNLATGGLIVGIVLGHVRKRLGQQS